MNACPDDDELLRFLDGDLPVEDDAWIVVHVEHCTFCQERLERLTRGGLALGEQSTIETEHADRWRNGVQAGTEIEGQGSIPLDEGGDLSREVGALAVATIDLGRDRRPPGELGYSLDPDPDVETEEAARDDRTVDTDPHRTMPPDPEDLAPREIHRADDLSRRPFVDGYDILQRLGEGGMGVVFKARHVGLNRLVALKMIRGGSQARADYFTRFRVEAEAVARLRNHNIIQIYDIGEAGGLPFVALELLDGGSLDQRLAGNPQAGGQAAELMITLARAIHVAHESGIVHRDLKPSNVLYSSDDVPKVTDFGLAKMIDSDAGQTQSGQIMGSPSYMAPEQAQGDSRLVGPAADVYALGAMLYEMLTGRPPFKGETPMETIRQVIYDDPVVPSRLVPRVPRDLETICLKCLHKDPTRRYASARAMAEDLKRHLDGEPILGRRTATWERAVKWARRRPAAALAGAFVLLALVGAVAWLFAWQESQLKRSRTILAAVDDGSRLEREAGAVASRPELEALQDVHSRIANFLPRLENLRDDESVAGLGARLAGHRESLRQQIHLLESKQVDLQRLTNERQQFEGFRDRYNQALFHDTRYTGLDLPDDQAATQRAAVAALKVYGAAGSGDNWALGSLPVSLSPSDRAEIAGACYELLLVLSQAEATPEGGLKRLDQAARLHPAPTRAYHFRRAVCLERAGDRQGAGRERLAAEGQPVATALDHYLAGQERYRRNEPIAAIRHFDEALRQQPGHFWAHCLSAICWLQLGDPPAARAGFTACLDGESGRGFAWLYILRGLASSRGLENARPEEMRLRSEAAEADYRRAMVLLEAKPNDELRYVLLVNRGLLRYQRGDLDATMADLEAAIRLGDLQSLASTALADVFRKQGRYTEAFDQFSRAIAHRPDWAPLYRFRADVVLEIKAPTPAQRAQALSDLDRAIRLEKPDNRVLARDHTRRGRLLAAEGRDVEALAACDAAIEQVRDYEEAHRQRLDVLLRLKRHDDVIRSCDALIAGGKASAAIYERRALARELIRDLAGAIEDFTSAMALGGDRPKLLRRRGWAYIVADSPRLALHDFQEAIRRDPSNADAYTGRGLARLRYGEHREAVADAARALSLGETTADLTFKAARVYALAAIVVTAKARKNGQESVQLVSRYQERAAGLLRETIRLLPPERRESFVNEVIRLDPALWTLRRRLWSKELAGPSPSPAAGDVTSQ